MDIVHQKWRFFNLPQFQSSFWGVRWYWNSWTKPWFTKKPLNNRQPLLPPLSGRGPLKKILYPNLPKNLNLCYRVTLAKAFNPLVHCALRLVHCLMSFCGNCSKKKTILENLKQQVVKSQTENYLKSFFDLLEQDFAGCTRCPKNYFS